MNEIIMLIEKEIISVRNDLQKYFLNDIENYDLKSTELTKLKFMLSIAKDDNL